MKKIIENGKTHLLNILIYISAIFVIGCYGLYLIISIVQNSEIITIILPLAVIILALVPIVFINKLHKVIKIFFCAGMCVYMVSFIIFSTFIILQPDDNYTGLDGNVLVLVYGCRTFGYTPSNTLKLRLDKSLEILEMYPDSLCIVSGGQGTNETIPEAVSMKAYLEANGIDKERIYAEPDSHSTIENIKYSSQMIENNSLSDYEIVSVSSEFHLPRIELIFKYFGLDSIFVASHSIFPSILFSNLVREYMSYVKLLLFVTFNLV